MHYHLVAGIDTQTITHESTYDDLEQSLYDFVGLVNNLFKNQISGRIEIAKRNMRKIAESDIEQVVYIGQETPIKLFWFTCNDCKAEELIPSRN